VRINKCLTLPVATLIVIGWTTGCGVKTEPKSGVANQPAVLTAGNSNQPAAVSSPAGTNSAGKTATAGGSLASPTEAYKAAYTARQNKDVEGLKRVLSKDVLDFLLEMGKTEKKTVDDELKDLCEQPQAPKAEVRGEKINGDRATLEYLGEGGKWSPMDFVKEGNDWKMTIPSSPEAGKKE
jgi:hypothetical protein